MAKPPYNYSLVPRENRAGEVTVPASYNSDRPPVLGLRSMSAHVRADYEQPGEQKVPREQAPLRLTLVLNANAEAVKRLAAFFGLYDREAWNRYARENNLPLVPEPMALPGQGQERDLRALPAFASDTEPSPPPPSTCSSCSHGYHEGRCPACDCLGDGFGVPR